MAGLEWKNCFIYLDDVLIALKTFEEHLTHLQEVSSNLCEANLNLKPKKCGLLRKEVDFLRHLVSADGIHPNPTTTDKIKSYPTPTSATEVCRFLGLASYYPRLNFVPNFASIADPLHALTRKSLALNGVKPLREPSFASRKF